MLTAITAGKVTTYITHRCEHITIAIPASNYLTQFDS